MKYLIPLPVPAGIYGIAIMFLGLHFKWIPLSAVRETGKFLMEIMPLMFIPAAAGLMESWRIIRPVYKYSFLWNRRIRFCTIFITGVLYEIHL